MRATEQLKSTRARAWLVLALLLFVAALLRTHRLGAQSLWYDEGNSARIAERSVQLIIAGAAGDIHPPLYYLALKVWRSAFGESEAALRALSAVCSVLTVALAWLIGRMWFGAQAATWGAGLLAFAPFAVYYAQEARMYALLSLWATASTLALYHLAQQARPSLTSATAYVLCSAAGLWTQYGYTFVMVAQALAFAIWSRLRIELMLRYGALTVLSLLAFAPWASVAARQVLGWQVDRPPVGLGDALLEIARAWVVGRMLPMQEALTPMLTFGGLALVGLKARDGWRLQRESLAALALALTPAALLLAANAYREAYLKVLLVSLPPVCLLAGNGIATLAHQLILLISRSHALTLSPPRALMLSRSRAITLCALMLALGVAWSLTPALRNLYDNPTYARDDYRGIQRLIAASAQPNDAVLFLAPNQWEAYTYYQRDDRNLYPLLYRPARYEEVAARLEAITARHPRLFALFYAEREADPDGWQEQWLNANTHKVHEQWVGNIRLAVFAAPRGDLAAACCADARFGDHIRLVEARSQLQARTGDMLAVLLRWSGDAQIERRYKVFLHIGAADRPPLAQFDSEPAQGARPTFTWQVGEVIHDRRGVWLRDVPPGRHDVFIGLYDAESGARLPITLDGAPIGDRLRIGTVEVR